MPFSEIQPLLNDVLSNPYNLLIGKAISSNRIPLGYTCRYVPEVLLSVKNFFPVRISAPQISGTETADAYMSSVICSYSKSLLEYAIDGRFDFLGGFVFAASCDHLRRFYDNLIYLKKPGFIHILDVPHKRSENALKWYIEELKILIESISSNFKVKINDDNLKDAILHYNDFLEHINLISDLRKKDYPPITGAMFHKLYSLSHCAPKDMIIEQIKKIYNSIKDTEIKKSYSARLMIIGSHLDDPGYIEIIESMGCIVVADRFCTGSLPKIAQIDNTNDPLKSIANHSLQYTFCPRMMEDFNRRVNEIFKIIKEFNVDGVIVESMKFCDIWGIESSPLVMVLRGEKVPVLRLEREYRFSGEGQLRTRIQAFLESIRK